MNHRIIARLDIKGPNLVKGIHLEGLRVLGQPESFSRYYYEQGADELMYMDVVASLYERNSLHDIITKTAKEAFIPLTVGGGVRTIDDIRNILRAGADKISINTAAINHPALISEAAKKFGSSTIVVTIEAIRSDEGEYYAYTDNGREFTGVEVIAWAKQAESLGAGEIVITSVDQEGTGKGFDEELTKRVSEAVKIPVIAHGGAGSIHHIQRVIQKGKADAVAIAGVVHYAAIVTVDTCSASGAEGNVEFLSKRNTNTHIKGLEISEIKEGLLNSGIPCRIVKQPLDT